MGARQQAALAPCRTGVAWAFLPHAIAPVRFPRAQRLGAVTGEKGPDQFRFGPIRNRFKFKI